VYSFFGNVRYVGLSALTTQGSSWPTTDHRDRHAPHSSNRNDRSARLLPPLSLTGSPQRIETRAHRTHARATTFRACHKGLPLPVLSQLCAIGVDRFLITAGRIEDLLVTALVEQHAVNSVDVDFRDPAPPEVLE